MSDDEARQYFTEVLRSATPTINVLFNELRARHSMNLPAALVAAGMLFCIMVRVSKSPLSAEELIEICNEHLEVFGYHETH